MKISLALAIVLLSYSAIQVNAAQPKSIPVESQPSDVASTQADINQYENDIDDLFSSDIDVEKNEDNTKLLLSYRKKICKDSTPDAIIQFWNKSEDNRKKAIIKDYQDIVSFQVELRRTSMSLVNPNIVTEKEISGNNYIFSSEWNKNKYSNNCQEKIKLAKKNIADLAAYRINIYPSINISKDKSVGSINSIKDIKVINSAIFICNYTTKQYKDMYMSIAISGVPVSALNVNKENIVERYVFESTNKMIRVSLDGFYTSSYNVVRLVNINKFVHYQDQVDNEEESGDSTVKVNPVKEQPMEDFGNKVYKIERN